MVLVYTTSFSEALHRAYSMHTVSLSNIADSQR